MVNSQTSAADADLRGTGSVMKGTVARSRGLCFSWLLAFVIGAWPASGSDSNQLISQMAHASWGSKEGVVDVTAITQTADGYLWVATAEGLFCFDGIEFTLWQPPADTKGTESTVVVLCASRDGGLWMGSKNGASLLRGGVVSHFTATNGLPEGEVTSILEDRSGAIWVATTKGLAKFDGGHWAGFGSGAGLTEGRTRVELEDRKGNLWVAVDDPEIAGGTLLGCLRPGQNRFELASEHFGTVAMLREAPDGTLWVAETSQSVRPVLGRSEDPVGQSRAFGVQSKAILFDRDGLMWIGATGRGLFRIDYGKLSDERGELELPKDRFDEKRGLSSDFISCAYEDQEGNVWIGSTGGLDRFRNNRIVSWSVPEGLNYDQRLAIVADADGALWTGSEQGFQHIIGSQVETLGFDWISSEGGNGIYSLYASGAGDVWVGALNGLGHIKGTEHGPVPIAGGMELRNVTAITQDHENGLWLCDQLRGVARLSHDKVRVFSTDAQLPSQVVNVAMTDPLGNIWLGFQDGGISCYQNGKFRMYPLPQSVLALHCDRNGRLWAAGLGGLSRFNQDHFELLKTTTRFPNSELSGLVEDNQGFFWIASRAGLVRVHPRELGKAMSDPTYEIEHEVFSSSDGLRGFPRQSRPFPIAAKSRDGRIWIATTAGLATIDPSLLKKSATVPPVHIVRAWVGGRKFEPMAEVKLPAGTKDLKIDYTAPSFADPNRILFKCKLEGYDEQWREVGKSREISYSGLRPRHYEFRVMACNRDGVWGEGGTTWKFSLEPAFYQTGWFVMAGVAAGGLIVWGFYRWKLARATAQTEARLNARMGAQMDERKRIAQELHDTLLQGFTGIRLKLWAISQQFNGVNSAAGDQLKQVIGQADKCLAESRRSVWALRLPRLEETDLATALKTVVNDLAADTNLQWDFKASGAAERFSEIVEFNLLRIGEEAVANVIRHAKANKLSVELNFEPRKITMRISDDGQGFNPELVPVAAGKHFGLAGMKERATIVGGRLFIDSQLGGPTVLTVVIG